MKDVINLWTILVLIIFGFGGVVGCSSVGEQQQIVDPCASDCIEAGELLRMVSASGFRKVASFKVDGVMDNVQGIRGEVWDSFISLNYETMFLAKEQIIKDVVASSYAMPVESNESLYIEVWVSEKTERICYLYGIVTSYPLIWKECKYFLYCVAKPGIEFRIFRDCQREFVSRWCAIFPSQKGRVKIEVTWQGKAINRDDFERVFKAIRKYGGR